MKLPRWLVIGMLTSSVLSVLAAAGWWWVTWPDRTAREFLCFMSDGSFDKARQMIHEGSVLPLRLDDLRAANAQNTLDSEPRDLADVIQGIQRFRVKGPRTTGDMILDVKLGKVVTSYLGPY